MPDFILLHDRYQKQLDNGERAQIKRAATVDDLLELPAFYRLISGVGAGELKQLARCVFFLSYIEKHCESADPLGRQLKNNKISEKRLFHIIRAESPNDLIQLRRVVQQAKLQQINWDTLGKAFFYWGKRQKQQLMQDFYLQAPTKDEELS